MARGFRPTDDCVAFRVRETNWEDNSYIRQLWVVDVATGKSFQLTRGKKSIEGFEWSPDSRWLAFVTEREQSAIVPPEPGKKDDDREERRRPGREKRIRQGRQERQKAWRRVNPATISPANPPRTSSG